MSKPRAGPLTFRIFGIPLEITQHGFQDILARLTEELAITSLPENHPKLLKWSFAPLSAHNAHAATVTFKSPPAPSQLESVLYRVIGDSNRLKVDLDFFGLTPLADPGEASAVDIIAVTGLAGHAFGSWKSRGGTDMWLRDFLPQSLPNARILTYGYDTRLTGSQSIASIIQLSKSFLECVKIFRSENPYRPIIFIGHSLGGLVVKQVFAPLEKALVHAAEGSADDNEVFMSCYAIMFFGVPNRGLDISKLTSMVKGQPNEDLVTNLDPSSPFLRLLHEMFYRNFIFEDSEIISFYETQLTSLVEWSPKTASWERIGQKVMMVSQSSATYAGKYEKTCDQLPIDADHSAIVKFSGPDNQDYTIIQSRLQNLVVNAPKFIQKRIAEHKKSATNSV